MARPKLNIDPKQLIRFAKIALQFQEIADVLSVDLEDLRPFEKLIQNHWPSDDEFIRIRRRRLARMGFISNQSKINHTLRQRIRGQIAEMILRELGDLDVLIGYSLSQLADHLQSLFEPGMNWENAREWHIDHIKPRSQFKISDLKECFALSNLRPLWAKDNLRRKYG